MKDDNFPFRGQRKNGDTDDYVYGFGCYTDQSSRHFIITDEPIEQTFVQVEKIEHKEIIA